MVGVPKSLAFFLYPEMSDDTERDKNYSIYNPDQVRVTWGLIVVATALSLICDIILLWKYRGRRQKFHIRTIFHFCLANALFSGPCFVYCLLHVVGTYMPESGFFCQTQGPILFITIMACTTFLALESIHRYLSIGHGWTVSTRTEDNMIIGAWTWAITSIAVARLVSWIKPGMYDWGYKNEMWCGIRHDSQPALAALIGVMVIPPLLILVFCYTSIYLHVRKVLKDEASILTGRRKYQYKCAKTMGAYVATFLASWSGIMLLWVVCGLTGKEPLWWQETAVTTLAHLSGVFSFIQVTIANWDRAGSPDALTFPLT